MSFQELFSPGRPVLEISTFPRIFAGPEFSSKKTPSIQTGNLETSACSKTQAIPRPKPFQDPSHSKTQPNKHRHLHNTTLQARDIGPIFVPPHCQLTKLSKSPAPTKCVKSGANSPLKKRETPRFALKTRSDNAKHVLNLSKHDFSQNIRC